MDAERGLGPSNSFVAAIAGHKRRYDKFVCPLKNECWHKQCQRLIAEIKRIPSGILADMMRSELKDILFSKRATK